MMHSASSNSNSETEAQSCLVVFYNRTSARACTSQFKSMLADRKEFEIYSNEKIEETIKKIHTAGKAVVFFDIQEPIQYTEVLNLLTQLAAMIQSNLVKVFGIVENLTNEHIRQLQKMKCADILQTVITPKALTHKLTNFSLIVNSKWTEKNNKQLFLASKGKTNFLEGTENWSESFADLGMIITAASYDFKGRRETGALSNGKFLDYCDGEFTIETERNDLYVSDFLKVNISIKKNKPPLNFSMIGEILEVERTSKQAMIVTIVLKEYDPFHMERFLKLFSKRQEDTNRFLKRAKGEAI